ncbi:hypothetical protein, partial [Streptomyces sp. Ru62]|uniref:hypothetical protein n=1 Tax=Streptomyces sp. Ru62 TaxID=2080745 RepID=UPI001CA5D3D7
FGLPQQQSRHTTTRHGAAPVRVAASPAASSAGLSGTPRHSPPGEVRPGVTSKGDHPFIPGDDPSPGRPTAGHP